MPTQIASISTASSAVTSTNKLIRNTYTLLAMTLLFSAVTASLSVMLRMPPITYLVSVGISIALMWLVLPRTANSASGIGVVFAITGLLGFALGPILAMYLKLPHGPQLVATALGGTGVIFLGLSGYALTTRRNFNFMGGFLFVGMLVVLGASLANIFLAMPAMSLAVSAAVVMLMCGFILFDTSRMIHGGTDNYIVATVGLYMNIFNLFISLLQLLGFARDE
ncbi:MAG: Bax inhibitor-1/YccA family protein [Proteobacteria bacterium]|jgi:modulator of FtsH protease|nr:Bax inhibitor-1/YccA family protein [Pseudomonadota bacterium]